MKRPWRRLGRMIRMLIMPALCWEVGMYIHLGMYINL